jgi:secreted trypsin-like serine protease
MQEAEVPVVSDTEAKRDYDSDYAPALMLAPGEEGWDTCQGDSGCPTFVQKSTTGRFFQIGITSFGKGCGARKYPGVYTEANSEDIRPFIFRAAEN